MALAEGVGDAIPLPTFDLAPLAALGAKLEVGQDCACFENRASRRCARCAPAAANSRDASLLSLSLNPSLIPFFALKPSKTVTYEKQKTTTQSADDPASQLPADALNLCAAVADCLHRTGCLVVRAPGVGEADNDRFLDAMEAYFSRPDDAKMADARPQFSYQVGATPSGVEAPRCLRDPGVRAAMAAMAEGHEATPVTGAGAFGWCWLVGGPRRVGRACRGEGAVG